MEQIIESDSKMVMILLAQSVVARVIQPGKSLNKDRNLLLSTLIIIIITLSGSFTEQ